MIINSLNQKPVFFGVGAYEELAKLLQSKEYSSIFVLTDSNTVEYCLPYFLQNLATELPIEIIEIEAGESNKSIDTCMGVWQSMAELGADRHSVLINLGGGVVTDLGGFVASTFKRGIDYVNIPTSLLSMVDASVGGKTGVDLGVLKNEIGLFSLSEMVIVDVKYLETLPQEEMLSGLAEMFKHGLIADDSYWKKMSDLSQFTLEDLQQLIYRSVEIKNKIVCSDPKEKNIRKKLNFGHTVGHSLESFFLQNNPENPLLHGFAVAAGIVIEAHLSYQKQLIDEVYLNEITSVLGNYYSKIDWQKDWMQDVIERMRNDKKNKAGVVYFVLLNGRGDAIWGQEVTTEMLENAFLYYFEQKNEIE